MKKNAVPQKSLSIELTQTQRVGLDLLEEQLRRAQKEMNDFKALCVIEGGGDLKESWTFDGLKFVKNDDSSSKPA